MSKEPAFELDANDLRPVPGNPIRADGMDHHLDFLRQLVGKGGPDRADYYDLDAWIAEIADQARAGVLSGEDLTALRGALGDAFTVETMQGFMFHKPHGYAGDFEIIDRIYQRYVSTQPHLSKWDEYLQEHGAAAHAVRNRVQYFVELLNMARQRLAGIGRSVEVLNLASGPGRDMLRFFQDNPGAAVHIDCVEQDQNAVNHAQALCRDHLESISFHLRNALRFQSGKKYDLIWSAGLFDYFEDNVFVFMLERLAAQVAEGGEIVIGNFSPINSSRPYMELLEWHLHHRSPTRLKALALAAGFSATQVTVKQEPTGVNLFLHIGLPG